MPRIFSISPLCRAGLWWAGWLLAIPLGWCAEAGRLVIDARESLVEIVVKATVDSFTGRLDAYDATIDVEPATGRVVAARFGFAFAAVQTGKDGRDRAMHQWQESETFPAGVFQLARLEREPGQPWMASGTLELHGVVHEVKFPLAVTSDGSRYAFDGEVVLDTRDYGLPVIRKFAVLKVDPKVLVRFHLQGHLPAPVRS